MVSYCINALCNRRVNDIQNATQCNSCGASLLIQNRFRLIQKFRPEHIRSPITVYEGLDVTSNNPVIAKVVEIFSRNIPNLLTREQEILSNFPDKLYPRINESTTHYFEVHPSPETDSLTAAVLILPKISGIDSNKWIQKNGPITQTMAIGWIFKLLPYLKLLSEIAVIHRDVKPSNIIVSETEDLTLIDYGTARKIDDRYLSIISDDVVNSVTEDYHIITRIHSSGYTAPEQNQGKAVPQSDYFSLGRTVIYWITGRSPTDLLDLDTNRVDWSKFESATQFDQCFLAFLERLTHPNPTKRPLTLDDIEIFLTERLPQQIREERRRNSKQVKAVKALTIGAGVVGLFMLGRFTATRALNAAGNQALTNGNPAQAANQFRRAIILDGHFINAIHNLGVACQKLGDHDCARENLEKAIALEPTKSYSVYQLGVFEEDQNEIGKAAQLYNKAIELDPTNVQALNRIARLKILEGNSVEAKTYLNQALALNPMAKMRAVILKNQGWIAYQEEDYVTAISLLDEAIELDSEFADPFCLIAQSYEAQGNKELAIGYWTACLQLPILRPEAGQWRSRLLENLQKE